MPECSIMWTMRKAQELIKFLYAVGGAECIGLHTLHLIEQAAALIDVDVKELKENKNGSQKEKAKEALCFLEKARVFVSCWGTFEHFSLKTFLGEENKYALLLLRRLRIIRLLFYVYDALTFLQTENIPSASKSAVMAIDIAKSEMDDVYSKLLYIHALLIRGQCFGCMSRLSEANAHFDQALQLLDKKELETGFVDPRSTLVSKLPYPWSVSTLRVLHQQYSEQLKAKKEADQNKRRRLQALFASSTTTTPDSEMS